MCGCALIQFGAPCVAQRVCAMPKVPVTGSLLMTASSSEILPGALRTWRPLAVTSATPARVVAAVFEALEALEEEGRSGTRADVADYSAHMLGRLGIRDSGFDYTTELLQLLQGVQRDATLRYQLLRAGLRRGLGDHSYDRFGAARADVHPAVGPCQTKTVLRVHFGVLEGCLERGVHGSQRRPSDSPACPSRSRTSDRPPRSSRGAAYPRPAIAR